MVSAPRSSRRLIVLGVALATLVGCASSGKKKVAAAETNFSDEPAPRWESAGETLPPAAPPPPPPSPPPQAVAAGGAPVANTTASATTAPAKGAAGVPGKNGARPATPAKVGSRGAEPVPKAAEPVGVQRVDPKAVRPTGAVATTSGRPAAPVSDSELLAPVLTFDAPGGRSASRPAAAPPAPPPVAAKPAETKPVEAKPEAPSKPEKAEVPIKAEPPARYDSREPSPRDRDRDRDRDRESDEPPPRDDPPPRSKKAAVYDDPPADLPASARRGDLRGVIGGKRIVFRRGVILGNRKHGYALQAFESLSASSSTRMGEVNARIDAAELAKGRNLPITLIFLQIPDDSSRSVQGVRALTCSGKGTLVLDSLPTLPKRLPRRDELEAGDADGSLSIQVVCTRDSREFGAFAIEGRLGSRVVITPPDL